eukprot:TRINITY_DN2084_c0_g1_i1.p1 TRINITY_DN2084_c0_g1~~TRINITY_DN2084_c0_g1_i1.p1  ORF type:complete len:447 (+),score=102.75 TRINITY_DN2084_c0_g1_i1:174-1514(+)
MEKIESLKRRCRDAESEIRALPPLKISEPCKNRLLKVVQGELKFLSRLSSSSACSICCNPKHIIWSEKTNRKGLAAHLHELKEAALASGILRPMSILVCFANGVDLHLAEKLQEEFGAEEKVDFKGGIVAGKKGNLNLPDEERTYFDKNIFEDVEDGDWINIVCGGFERYAESKCGQENDAFPDVQQLWMTYEIKISKEDQKYSGQNFGTVQSIEKLNTGLSQEQRLTDSFNNFPVHLKKEPTFQQDTKFYRFLSAIEVPLSNDLTEREADKLEDNFVNLDTTALVALVSGLSNGCAKELTELSEEDMYKRFKTTSCFMRKQAESELEHPLLDEALPILSGKRLIVCGYVDKEFQNLISMCSGPNEKRRAECLQKYIMISPDSPSARVLSLPETAKIKLKHKIIFGTGDSLHIPTYTANMAFVRAVMQTGMSLGVLEHRPRALVRE